MRRGESRRRRCEFAAGGRPRRRPGLTFARSSYMAMALLMPIPFVRRYSCSRTKASSSRSSASSASMSRCIAAIVCGEWRAVGQEQRRRDTKRVSNTLYFRIVVNSGVIVKPLSSLARLREDRRKLPKHRKKSERKKRVTGWQQDASLERARTGSSSSSSLSLRALSYVNGAGIVGIERVAQRAALHLLVGMNADANSSGRQKKNLERLTERGRLARACIVSCATWLDCAAVNPPYDDRVR